MSKKMIQDATREELAQKIAEISFYLDEIALYLTIHPCDEDALEAKARHQAIETRLENEFERRFGPIRMTGANECSHFSWIDDPWPWQYEANEV